MLEKMPRQYISPTADACTTQRGTRLKSNLLLATSQLSSVLLNSLSTFVDEHVSEPSPRVSPVVVLMTELDSEF